MLKVVAGPHLLRPTPTRCGPLAVTELRNLDTAQGWFLHLSLHDKDLPPAVRVPKQGCLAAPDQTASSPPPQQGSTSQSGLIDNWNRQASVERQRGGRVNRGGAVGDADHSNTPARPWAV